MAIYDYVHGNAAVPVKTKRVFLHTGTANRGYAVCYNWDAVAVDAENNALVTSYGRALGTTFDKWNDAHVLMVEEPSPSNIGQFAGVVAKESDGVVGPNWITIHVPGSICEVFTTAIISTGCAATAHRPQILGYTVCVNSVKAVMSATNSCQFRTGTFLSTHRPGIGSARMLAEISTGVTGNDRFAMAELLTGEQVGCVYVFSSTACCSALDSNAGKLPTFGKVILSCAVVSVTPSTIISVPNGNYAGQKLMIVGPHAAITTVVDFNATFIAPAISAESVAGMTFVSAVLSAESRYLSLEWNGINWTVLPSVCAIGTSA